MPPNQTHTPRLQAAQWLPFGAIKPAGWMRSLPRVSPMIFRAAIAPRWLCRSSFAPRKNMARSIVLMGGTQADNARAIRFYQKFGFVHHGGYQTEVFNHDMRLLITPDPMNGVR